MIELSSVKPGSLVTVATIKTDDESLINKLVAMGVSPGISLILEQRFPSYVVKIGRTRAAFDEDTAKKIYVYPVVNKVFSE